MATATTETDDSYVSPSTGMTADEENKAHAVLILLDPMKVNHPRLRAAHESVDRAVNPDAEQAAMKKFDAEVSALQKADSRLTKCEAMRRALDDPRLARELASATHGRAA